MLLLAPREDFVEILQEVSDLMQNPIRFCNNVVREILGTSTFAWKVVFTRFLNQILFLVKFGIVFQHQAELCELAECCLAILDCQEESLQPLSHLVEHLESF